MIDTGTDLESYTNYDRFLPSETVKSISDVKTGKESELSEDAKAVVGDNLDKVLLVDVGWGNAKQSSYFSAGHVPGAVHINTDSYERPRVYVPEKEIRLCKRVETDFTGRVQRQPLPSVWNYKRFYCNSDRYRYSATRKTCIYVKISLGVRSICNELVH